MLKLLNFVAAGYETTASSLTWAAYVLALNHPSQERLRVEIKALLEETPVPNYNEIDRLPYLNNFIREVLRLHSPGEALILVTSRARLLSRDHSH